MTVRGEKVMLDADLAAVYGVATKVFNQAVSRNIDRFPPDFRFQLTKRERDEVVTNCDHLARLKFSAVRPWAFTEHGAVMAATVLKSPRAVEMSMFVVRAFVRLRHVARNYAALADKLDALERKVSGHDADLEQMFSALRALIAPRRPLRRQIGFRM
jgi:C4-dicarboxylate-specific signal transduction histidine kinase